MMIQSVASARYQFTNCDVQVTTNYIGTNPSLDLQHAIEKLSPRYDYSQGDLLSGGQIKVQFYRSHEGDFDFEPFYGWHAKGVISSGGTEFCFYSCDKSRQPVNC